LGFNLETAQTASDSLDRDALVAVGVNVANLSNPLRRRSLTDSCR